MKLKYFLALFAVVLLLSFTQEAKVFYSKKGNVKFISKAPLETISAESQQLKGALDLEKKTFLFTIFVNSFEGFNSPLQKEHFNENYLESEKIPKAEFKGKIIEDINLMESGTYPIRAKGILKIHNVEKEMIIKAKIISTKTSITVESNFKIQLKDFNINIPKVVSQKVADEIVLDIKMDLNNQK